METCSLCSRESAMEEWYSNRAADADAKYKTIGLVVSYIELRVQ